MNSLVSICMEMSECYEVCFLEIGTDKNHVHLLVQTVSTNSPGLLVKRVKNITERGVRKVLTSKKSFIEFFLVNELFCIHW